MMKMKMQMKMMMQMMMQMKMMLVMSSRVQLLDFDNLPEGALPQCGQDLICNHS